MFVSNFFLHFEQIGKDFINFLYSILICWFVSFFRTADLVLIHIHKHAITDCTYPIINF